MLCEYMSVYLNIKYYEDGKTILIKTDQSEDLWDTISRIMS